jgi:Type III secretion protein (HpaP)
MSSSKSIPFERIRVIAPSDSGAHRPRVVGRAFEPGRAAVPSQWGKLTIRKPESHAKPVGADDDDQDDTDLAPPAPGLAMAPTLPRETPSEQPSAAAPPPEPPPQVAQPSLTEEAQALPATPPSGPAGLVTEHHAASAPAPIAAIARSVRQAAVLRDLAELITNLCDGEENRLMGPWDMTLPLDREGLGSSTLHMRLSQATLSLRFYCESMQALEIVSARSDELKKLLDEQLRPPLDVSIDANLG